MKIKGLNNIGVYVLLLGASLCFSGISLAQKSPVTYFEFEDIRQERKNAELVRGETYVPQEVFAYVKESVKNTEFELKGKYYKKVKGVKGNAVLLDGYTAHIEVFEDDIPVIENGFTIEAWVALGAYPKNEAPILDHRRDEGDGYFNGYSLEIDGLGRLLLKVATRGKYEIAMSSDEIPLNTWTHVAGSYAAESGLSVYINGQLIDNIKLKEIFSPADPEETSMLIGKSRSKKRPYGTIRPEGTETSFTYIDGILDELKIHNSALSGKSISSIYKSAGVLEKPGLPVRKLPSGPKSPKVFRAVNTTLKYYEAWDAPWAIDKNADLVVQFDEADCKFVFWHGTSYIPNWVTENDIWFNNAFNESWNDHGSCEPMSDKKANYSTVKIVESNEARVVVQWRYGLVDVVGGFAYQDPETGWGDWTNETYTIYPDMVGVREDKLLSNAPRAEHEWQESIMVLGPGQSPEDILEYKALTLANIKGEKETYSWEQEIPPHFPPSPKNPAIQIINTKSKYRPFSVIRPQDNPRIDTYDGEIRRDISVFPWWNHWPVAPRPTDGRYAQFSDRAAHASISHWFWDAYAETDRSMTKLMLNGLTDKQIGDLIPLAKSWSNPAAIALNDKKHSAVYTPEERAYTIELSQELSELNFNLKGSDNSPIINPAFVVENWGDHEVDVSLNGEKMERGKDLRYDLRHSINSIDLIVWVKYEGTSVTSFSLKQK
ncbi:LamG domain-containing protein [Fulvivirgaceae bacterium BMA12]|uniref:LamG domain-containing protein n=1 Tax=Agaribacillus aureus TaxID=3051825 RepID=A0ABT8LG95_9BACT|nr:LamG domain-containing protein [Fulvivirgaceae bacterium BMA12]